MAIADAVLVLLAAFLGGALNAVAGGGSFLALPALISIGVPAVSANATTAVALWPGSVASSFAYRRDLDQPRAVWISLSVASLAGGVLGALLLLGTSNTAFLQLLPWLMLVASLTFTFGARFARRREGGHGPSRGAMIGAFALQLAIATYGGYFGGGMGIMMLAYFAAIGMTDIHAMNGLKAVLAVIINGVAIVAFVSAGAIAWTPGLVMIGGAISGGWVGARLARRVAAARVRTFVTVVGWGMTAYFFWRAYH
ncbi:MAG: sulfite exporter TauE/SafE family protein [Deltaproteobacteria bacterium]|nr:sulfite exporter TauE/SafE family protein [Deltaproteobacteria bacterium]